MFAGSPFLSLASAVALVLLAPTHAQSQDYLTKGDQEFYRKAGSCFGAWAGPWSTYGKTALRHGIDFADTITVRQATFPSQTGISWYWPNKLPGTTGVYGYNMLGFGDYDGGPVKGCVVPRQFKGITSLLVNYSVSWPETRGDWNLLAEMYAYTGGGDSPAKKLEIGFLPRISARGFAFAKAGEGLGAFQDAAGRSWNVYRQGNYVMLVGPNAESGTLDFLGAARFLQKKHLLTGGEYFRGLAFGVEPVSGAGYLWVASLSVDYR